MCLALIWKNKTKGPIFWIHSSPSSLCHSNTELIQAGDSLKYVTSQEATHEPGVEQQEVDNQIMQCK